MRRLIARLSPRAEFWTIVLLSFGFFIAESILMFVTHKPGVLRDS